MLFEGVSYGTGFITGDGREMRTALHVVRDFALDARTRGLSGRLPVYILNSHGQIMYGPNNTNAQVAATFDGALDTSVYEGPDRGRFNLDQVLIRLDRRISDPIPLSRAPLAEGDPVYISGVPRKTEDRAMFNALDSNGRSVLISRGTALGVRTLAERLRRSGFSADEATAAQLLQEGIAVTADGAPRQSGGPILNARGEVVGIYTSGLPQSGAVYPFRVSYGTNRLIQVP